MSNERPTISFEANVPPGEPANENDHAGEKILPRAEIHPFRESRKEEFDFRAALATEFRKHGYPVTLLENPVLQEIVEVIETEANSDEIVKDLLKYRLFANVLSLQTMLSKSSQDSTQGKAIQEALHNIVTTLGSIELRNRMS